MGCQNFASGDHLRCDFQRLIAEYCGVDERCECASLDGMEQRSEPRRDERLVVTIKGRDNTGRFFIQEAVASSLSTSGALLSGICREVRPGDLVCVEYASNKVPLQGRLAEGLRITSTHPSGCTPPQGRPLSMGEVLTTGTGSLGAKPVSPASSARTVLKRALSATPVRVFLPSAARGHCNISYSSVFSAYIHRQGLSRITYAAAP
jgi:hypothetical protein